MKIGFYMCDAGCFTIAIGNNFIGLPNGVGDGDFKVYLYDNYTEYYSKNPYANHTRIISGKFENAVTLDYDCYTKIENEHIVFELNGRFDFFHDNSGNIHIVKWEK